MATVIKKKRGAIDFRLLLSLDTAAFYLYFLLICIPGIARVGDIGLSILIFPAIILGYGKSSLDFLHRVLPGARNLLFALLLIIGVYSIWSLITAFGVSSFLRVFRPLYGHASGIGLVLAVFALSRTRQSAEQTRNATMTLFCVVMGASLFAGVGHYGDRLPGFFKHPNQLGVVAAMASTYYICCMIARGFRSMPANAGAFICTAALFLSGSKTNLLAVGGIAAVSVLVIALQNRNPKVAILAAVRDYAAVIILVTIAIPVLAIVNVRASSVLGDIFGGDEDVTEYGTVVARQGLWSMSWDSFTNSPVFGVGAGQRLENGVEHSHNIFMDSLRTIGFPGFALIAAFILIVIFYILSSISVGRALQNDPRSPLADPDSRGPFVGSLMAMTSYLISNQMSDSFGPSTLPFFYLFLGFSAYFLSRSVPSGVATRTGPPGFGRYGSTER